MNIGNRIKIQRLKCGFTQAEVAARLGIAQTTYSKMEAGKINVALKKLISIAQLFAIEAAMLIDEPAMQTGAQKKRPENKNTPDVRPSYDELLLENVRLKKLLAEKEHVIESFKKG